MRRIHLFNPDNDTALAADRDNYTPPRAALQLRLDGSLLPMWWATKGDFVLSPYADVAESLSRKYGLEATAAESVDPCETRAPLLCCPWGWSRSARHRFEKAGVGSTLLPSDSWLDRYRLLSHRRTTIEVNRRLHQMLPNVEFPEIPSEIFDVTEIQPGDYCVKLPWSSSGRGVRHLVFDGSELALTPIEGMIHSQGSVMLESYLDRVKDFAALFESCEGRVHYRGLSLFDTSPSGAYLGNRVAGEDNLRTSLSVHLSLGVYDRVVECLEEILTDVLGGIYRGWLGVDMMVYNERGIYRLAPCIEINLRMTMGVVAHLLRSHPAIAPRLPGRFSVSPMPAASTRCVDLSPVPRARFKFLYCPDAQNVCKAL